jgi:hypothetical protein
MVGGNDEGEGWKKTAAGYGRSARTVGEKSPVLGMYRATREDGASKEVATRTL